MVISASMSLKAIQPAARRAQGSSPEPTVNNFAAVSDENLFSNPLRPQRVPTGRIAPRQKLVRRLGGKFGVGCRAALSLIPGGPLDHLTNSVKVHQTVPPA